MPSDIGSHLKASDREVENSFLLDTTFRVSVDVEDEDGREGLDGTLVTVLVILVVFNADRVGKQGRLHDPLEVILAVGKQLCQLEAVTQVLILDISLSTPAVFLFDHLHLTELSDGRAGHPRLASVSAST